MSPDTKPGLSDTHDVVEPNIPQEGLPVGQLGGSDVVRSLATLGVGTGVEVGSSTKMEEPAGTTEGIGTIEATELLPPTEAMRQQVEAKIIDLLKDGFGHSVIQKGLNESNHPHEYVRRLLI